jgi:hypothetical protein
VVVKLNRTALTNARKRVKEGQVVRDQRDDWSEHAPTAAEENKFIEDHGWGAYSAWHLGVDTEKPAHTKGRYIASPSAISPKCTGAPSSHSNHGRHKMIMKTSPLPQRTS